MLRTTTHWTAAAIALGVLLGPACATTLAQSTNDLRRENQALKSRVRDLEAELDAAQQAISRLEAQIKQLNEALQAGGGARPVTPADVPPVAVSIDESVPDASPRALLSALIADYEEHFKDMEFGEDQTRLRDQYLRVLAKWRAGVNREYRTAIEWHVRAVDRVGNTPNGPVIRVVAVDPETDVALGEPFEILLPGAIARRLSQRPAGQDDEVFLLRGVLVPKVQANPDRAAVGPFDAPRFIGPFAEFGFNVEVQTMIPPPKEDDRARARADQPGSDESGE